jgi:hypothetical protein
MIRIKQNKDTSIHGTYRSGEVHLKLLLENNPELARTLQQKLETFVEGDEGTLVFSFNSRIPQGILKLERDRDSYQVSFTKKMEITKEHMDEIVSMLSQMSSACDKPTEDQPRVASSTNLLNES